MLSLQRQLLRFTDPLLLWPQENVKAAAAPQFSLHPTEIAISPFLLSQRTGKKEEQALNNGIGWVGLHLYVLLDRFLWGRGLKFPPSQYPARCKLWGMWRKGWTPSRVPTIPTCYLNNHHGRNGRSYLNGHFFLRSFIRHCRNLSCITPPTANHLGYPRVFLEMDFRNKEAPRLELLSLEIMQGLNCSDQYSASVSLHFVCYSFKTLPFLPCRAIDF